MSQNGANYTTTSGLKDGEKVTSSPTLAEGKNIGKANETSPEKQAQLEIEARYKKQLKLSYFKKEEDIDEQNFIKPLLAKNYNDYKEVIDFSSKDWILQCKFNGHRCLATKDGLFTRRGEKYLSIPHIEKSLQSFFDDYPDAVLYGEIHCRDLRDKLNEVSKLIRRTVHLEQEDFDNSEAMKHYQVYAVPTNFLINPEGRIVALNLRGEELVNALKRLIK